jgi:hypothetical protein
VTATSSSERTLAALMATGQYDTDKEPHYLRAYEEVFGPLREGPVRLLELGVYHGASLRLWRDYFPRGLIVGLDAEAPPLLEDADRIRVYRGLQQDTSMLDRMAGETAPEGFDVVIDDASHVAALTRISFWHLFEHHLRPGGLYAIEDWGTGYWESWSDGRRFHPAHQEGMVGFVKELVDECGMADITDPQHGIPPPRASRFQRMQVLPGLVLVVKRA